MKPQSPESNVQLYELGKVGVGVGAKVTDGAGVGTLEGMREMVGVMVGSDEGRGVGRGEGAGDGKGEGDGDGSGDGSKEIVGVGVG